LTDGQVTQDLERSSTCDLCSILKKFETDASSSNEYLGVIGKNNKKYKLSIKRGDEKDPKQIICLEEILSPNYQLLRKDRMQLALRLTSSILQFCLTPWIDKTWQPRDFCVLSMGEEQNNEFSDLFVTRKFYSARNSQVLEAIPQSVDNIWSWYEEPILTKLGFALIELLLGRTLPELRGEQPGDESVDIDFLNFKTANDLINSGRIAREESKGYEDVVKACIRHQYLGGSGSGVKGLDSKDPSFFDNAEESIIQPLFAEFNKSWGLA